MKLDINSKTEKKYYSHRRLFLLLLIIGSWGTSLLTQPPKLKLATIFYPIIGEEKRIFDEKKGLDTSQIKVIYYNKTTIYSNRYWNNFFGLLDINSYFFGGHPREDVSDRVFRTKIIWILVFPFILGLWRIRIGWKWLGILFLLALLKNPDGWDFILAIPMMLILDNGINNAHRLWKELRK